MNMPFMFAKMTANVHYFCGRKSALTKRRLACYRAPWRSTFVRIDLEVKSFRGRLPHPPAVALFAGPAIRTSPRRVLWQFEL